MGEKIAMAQFMEKIATDFFAFAPHPPKSNPIV